MCCKGHVLVRVLLPKLLIFSARLPFWEKHLHLSSGKVIGTVPNIVRTMIPQRIVMQYNQYCDETNFKPLRRSTLMQILGERNASVRMSLQGLDYFAAEGGRTFDDLAYNVLLSQISK